MAYYKAITYIPGGKELKVEKNVAPNELYHAMRSVKKPEIITIFEGNLELTDELHSLLQRPKAYSTYVIYGGHFSEMPTDDALRDDIMFGLQEGNLITPVESVYGYQILKIEYLYPDEPIAPEFRAEPGEKRDDNSANTMENDQ
ncbi:hypothetical protein ACX0HA_08880 [Flavobacterium hauense]